MIFGYGNLRVKAGIAVQQVRAESRTPVAFSRMRFGMTARIGAIKHLVQTRYIPTLFFRTLEGRLAKFR